MPREGSNLDDDELSTLESEGLAEWGFCCTEAFNSFGVERSDGNDGSKGAFRDPFELFWETFCDCPAVIFREK